MIVDGLDRSVIIIQSLQFSVSDLLLMGLGTCILRVFTIVVSCIEQFLSLR